MSDTDGKITWFEVPAADTARARGFYALVLGWTFQPFDDTGEYQMTPEAGGGVYASTEDKGIAVYFGTSDLDASIAKVKNAGGTAGDPHEIPNVGKYSKCTDTVREGVAEAETFLEELATAGVDYDDVVAVLEVEGVQKFADAFDELIAGIEARRGELAAT